MIHVGSYSTGIVSGLMCERMIERYGRDACRFVFMDTLIEDDDNYRFMRDTERILKIEIIKLAEGRTPYQVFEDHHLIPSGRAVPCTFELKMDIFRKYIATLPKPVTVHIGYDIFELERCDATRANYEKLGYSVDFPMLWKPYELQDYSTVIRSRWGIEPPAMYAQGYTHANCGGRCVKQGMGDWIRTLVNHPDRFAEVEAWELAMRENPVNAEYAILKDRRFGGMIPMTLRELRQRYQAKNMPTLFELDAGSACVVCGIGG